MTAELTREAYADAFEAARSLAYTAIDAFEQTCGFAVDRARLDDAARVLACPVKVNPPHWQHGRVIYAAARRYLAKAEGTVNALDIGTAKGFSALCVLWAIRDSGRAGFVTSVDVLDPAGRVRRNTVAELDGYRTLWETLAPWPEALAIHFAKATGIDWLQAHADRIHLAFVDGKHTATVVRQEGKLLSQRQQAGDVAIFDDCQIPDICQAVVSLEQWYRMEYLTAGPRDYAVGVRR